MKKLTYIFLYLFLLACNSNVEEKTPLTEETKNTSDPTTSNTFNVWAAGRVQDCLQEARPGLQTLKEAPLSLEREEPALYDG